MEEVRKLCGRCQEAVQEVVMKLCGRSQEAVQEAVQKAVQEDVNTPPQVGA